MFLILSEQEKKIAIHNSDCVEFLEANFHPPKRI